MPSAAVCALAVNSSQGRAAPPSLSMKPFAERLPYSPVALTAISSMRKLPRDPVRTPRAWALALNGSVAPYSPTSSLSASVSASTWNRVEGVRPRRCGRTRLIPPEAVRRKIDERVVTSISSRRKSLPGRPRIAAITRAVPLNRPFSCSVSPGTNMATDWVKSFDSSARRISTLPPCITSVTLPLTSPEILPNTRFKAASRSSSPTSVRAPLTLRAPPLSVPAAVTVLLPASSGSTQSI